MDPPHRSLQSGNGRSIHHRKLGTNLKLFSLWRAGRLLFFGTHLDWVHSVSVCTELITVETVFLPERRQAEAVGWEVNPQLSSRVSIVTQTL